jgi:hypothetical protein
MENTTTHFFRDFFLFGLPFSFFGVHACMLLLPFSSGDGDLLFCGMCRGEKGSCKWDFVVCWIRNHSRMLSLSLSLPVDIDGFDCLLDCGVQEKERVAALNGNLVLKPKKRNSFLFLHFSSCLLHTERVVNTIVI